MAKKILFIGGSLNQTTMVFKISHELREFDCWFTPYFADGLVHWMAQKGMFDFSILGGQTKKATEDFLASNGLNVDYRGLKNNYDLVVTASDLLVPKNIRSKHIVLVQEGMLTPETFVYHIVRALRLPRSLANTSMTGLSLAYRKFCVASEGFKDWFVRKGVPAERIEVTGIPNFDDLEKYRQNDFPHKDFVLGATSCLREAWQYEDRRAFIFKTLDVAGGRQVVFKLHPNENHSRARREIQRFAPQALVFETGNTNHIIANCEAMVTKYSSVLLTALGLGKEVHSDIRPDLIGGLQPVQNGGKSAYHIAAICRRYL